MVKSTRRQYRGSHATRANRLASKKSALEKLQREIEELELQEKAWYEDQLAAAWGDVCKTLEKILSIENLDDVERVQELLADDAVVSLLQEQFAAATENVEVSDELAVENVETDGENTAETDSASTWESNDYVENSEY